MTLIEAAKLALEHGEFPQGSGIIRELRQAIAEAEQPAQMTLIEAAKLALEALEGFMAGAEAMGWNTKKAQAAITALDQAIADAEQQPDHTEQHLEKVEQQEPVVTMPSKTRYTVEVEGRWRTYWDNIHDAIMYAQRAVYAGPDNTTRALHDLERGQMAEWSYGFSAVRIYPPQQPNSRRKTHD